jgi:F-type H+-transporting ATPase subunit alpha
MNMEPESLQNIFDSVFAEIRQVRETLNPQLRPQEVGTITSVATGIAKVAGLPGVGFDELVIFPGNITGIAFNVDADELSVVLLGEYWHLQVGDEVRRTGRVMDVAVGEGLLGRVIDPLGRAKPLLRSTRSSISATRMCSASTAPSVSAPPPLRRPWQHLERRARWITPSSLWPRATIRPVSLTSHLMLRQASRSFSWKQAAMC